MQFVPEDGVYVYFRYDNNQTVMCIMNTNDREMTIDGNRFGERLGAFNKGKDVITGIVSSIKTTIHVNAKELRILELQ